VRSFLLSALRGLVFVLIVCWGVAEVCNDLKLDSVFAGEAIP
jgi:hypothetical protein